MTMKGPIRKGTTRNSGNPYWQLSHKILTFEYFDHNIFICIAQKMSPLTEIGHLWTLTGRHLEEFAKSEVSEPLPV